MNYKIATASRLGSRQSNEDSFTVVETPEATLMLLADGMGGHKGGKLASQTFVDSCAQMFNQTNRPIADPRQFLEDIIFIAHRDVLQAGKKQAPPIEPRTTCVLCLVQDGHAWWAHVGDSRLYHYRHSRMLSHTTDHSEVEQMVKQGVISKQEKNSHPYRNVVLQCIGSPNTPPRPSYSKKTVLQRGDTLLLCSDGLWSAFSEHDLGRNLRQQNLAQSIEMLASTAEEKTYPSSDNISVIALRWQASTAIDSAHLDPGGSEYDELSKGLDAINEAVRNLENKK